MLPDLSARSKHKLRVSKTDSIDIPATLAINPSNASTSRTKAPFPMPPMDGSLESSPMSSKLFVSNSVLAPTLADAAAASHPAWLAPMTHTEQTGFSEVRSENFSCVTLIRLCRRREISVQPQAVPWLPRQSVKHAMRIQRSERQAKLANRKSGCGRRQNFLVAPAPRTE